MRLTRTDILDAAREAVAGRKEIYGGPEDSFRRIAALWNAYLAPGDRQLTGFDVAMMLALLKIARARTAPGHTDNLVDLAGYAACAAEAVCRPEQQRPGRPAKPDTA